VPVALALHWSGASDVLAAFRAALQLGADAAELDVCLSADGVPVVNDYA
jgi:glycerophosphoryl diester phosphodiesterase